MRARNSRNQHWMSNQMQSEHSDNSHHEYWKIIRSRMHEKYDCWRSMIAILLRPTRQLSKQAVESNKFVDVFKWFATLIHSMKRISFFFTSSSLGWGICLCTLAIRLIWPGLNNRYSNQPRYSSYCIPTTWHRAQSLYISSILISFVGMYLTEIWIIIIAGALEREGNCVWET